jgi:hypothetical protein
MTNRFPTAWRIVEIPNGFAVDDATGRQLAVFYGRAAPNITGHTGCLRIKRGATACSQFRKLRKLLKLAPIPMPFAKAPFSGLAGGHRSRMEDTSQRS